MKKKPTYPYSELVDIINRINFYYKDHMHNDGWTIRNSYDHEIIKKFNFNTIYHFGPTEKHLDPHINARMPRISGEIQGNQVFRILCHFSGTSYQWHLKRNSRDNDYDIVKEKAQSHGLKLNEDGVIIGFDENKFNESLHLWTARELGLL